VHSRRRNKFHAGSYIKAEQMQQLTTPKGLDPPLPAVVRVGAYN